MRAKDLFESVSEEYLNNPMDFDKFWNPELYHYNKREMEWREKQGTGAITKPVPAKKDEKFTNQPDPNDIQSPGYRGLQSLKKKAGLPYDKKALAPDHGVFLPKEPSPDKISNRLLMKRP